MRNEKKAAIYVRVSTKRQDFQRQISELQEHARRNGFEVVHIIREVGSATKRRNQERPELAELLQLAESGAIGRVLVSEVSRLGRRPSETLSIIERLTSLKVSLYSQNFGLETLLPTGRTNPAASLIFMVFAELARIETEELRERILSGQEEALRQGKRIGRPSGITKDDAVILKQYPQVVRYLKANHSIREISKLTDVSTGTVQKVKRIYTKKTGQKK